MLSAEDVGRRGVACRGGGRDALGILRRLHRPHEVLARLLSENFAHPRRVDPKRLRRTTKTGGGSSVEEEAERAGTPGLADLLLSQVTAPAVNPLVSFCCFVLERAIAQNSVGPHFCQLSYTRCHSLESNDPTD